MLQNTVFSDWYSSLKIRTATQLHIIKAGFLAYIFLQTMIETLETEFSNLYFYFNLRVKPSISTHSKPATRQCTRHLICFVLEHSVFKTKHLRRLV